jgi:hypothetical protein
MELFRNSGTPVHILEFQRTLDIRSFIDTL